MSGKGINKKKWKKRLLSKYRVVIVNDQTFEDVYSFKLNLLNVLGGTTTLVFVLILSTVALLALTPLKEYIPGYSSSDLKTKAIDLALKVDSLEAESQKNKLYVESIKKALLGEVEVTRTSIDSLQMIGVPVNKIEHKDPSDRDKELRELVRIEDKYNIFSAAKPKVSQVLFAPVEGQIMRKYDPSSYHFGIDFLTPNNTPIKAIGKGTVMFVDWTIKDGYTIILLHEEGVISVYKHLSTINKSVYETVRSGEVLGLFDGKNDTSGKSENPYFHFEMWKDTYPLDSTLFIDYD
ncbi:MAG: M23 family metallopeptidase [Flavobacteriaceae bacterium]|jgi:murein DD-endopeptidase MepM/ murein hydrolase activator NlpD|nr:M23 family metallopeptidase [Flavobacteriaceae bacterium]